LGGGKGYAGSEILGLVLEFTRAAESGGESIAGSSPVPENDYIAIISIMPSVA